MESVLSKSTDQVKVTILTTVLQRHHDLARTSVIRFALEAQ